MDELGAVRSESSRWRPLLHCSAVAGTTASCCNALASILSVTTASPWMITVLKPAPYRCCARMRRCWMSMHAMVYRPGWVWGFIGGTSANTGAGSDPLICATTSSTKACGKGRAENHPPRQHVAVRYRQMGAETRLNKAAGELTCGDQGETRLADCGRRPYRQHRG